jgi:hypothetical protein
MPALAGAYKGLFTQRHECCGIMSSHDKADRRKQNADPREPQEARAKRRCTPEQGRVSVKLLIMVDFFR